MTQPRHLPQPNIKLQASPLAARLNLSLTDSTNWNAACALIEAIGNGGEITLLITKSGRLKRVSPTPFFPEEQEAC